MPTVSTAREHVLIVIDKDTKQAIVPLSSPEPLKPRPRSRSSALVAKAVTISV